MSETLPTVPLPEKSFIEYDDLPMGYDPTMQLEWRKDWYINTAVSPSVRYNIVLCQKFEGAFKSVWVKIPSSE